MVVANGNDYTKMVLLNSILPRICQEKNFKNTHTLVAEDCAEHFINSGQIGNKPILLSWIHEPLSDTSDTSESKNKSNNSTGNRNE